MAQHEHECDAQNAVVGPYFFKSLRVGTEDERGHMELSDLSLNVVNNVTVTRRWQCHRRPCSRAKMTANNIQPKSKKKKKRNLIQL